MKINRKLLACLMVLLLAAGWVSFGMQTGETYAAYHALQAEAGAAEMEGAVAVAQSSPAGEQLPQGSLVTVTFYDYTVPADEDVKMD